MKKIIEQIKSRLVAMENQVEKQFEAEADYLRTQAQKGEREEW